MPTCVTCGNNYERAFTIIVDKKMYIFDCFECAIHRLAPICSHCGCKIIGHGIESDSADQFYCCAHCARKVGVQTAKDHV